MIRTLYQVCSNLNESDQDIVEPHLGINIPQELSEVRVKIRLAVGIIFIDKPRGRT